MGPVSNPETRLSSECIFQNKNQTTTSNSRPVSEQTTSFGTKRRGRPTSNAARERSRVKTLRSAFLDLQRSLPAVPPDTKLSKLDVLVLATTYISHLMKTLNFVQASQGSERQGLVLNGALHPVKKWPMRSRLYAGIVASAKTPPINTTEKEPDWTRFPSSP